MNTCKNCTAPVDSNYCQECGEKVHYGKDRSFKHLFEEAFHFLTHFEGKFFTTLKTMFAAPGKLSLDFCHGIRKKYFKPLSFYLLVIIIYLIFPLFEGLNIKLKYHYNSPYGQYAHEMAEAVKEKRNYTEEALTEKFHYKSEKTSKFLLFLLLPFMALVSYAMAFRKNRYYYDHFIFSTETLSFFILFGFLLLPLLVRGMYIAGMTWINSEIVIGIILYGLFAVYASLAAGRFFNLRLGWRILYGTVFSMLLFVFLIFVYRLVLFWVVIHLL